jgi:hypothetical protein
VSEETFEEVVYRWHELMFRLDELDELGAAGITEEEAAGFDRERQASKTELERLESRLGQASVSGLRAGHERDRAYAQQMRQMDEEGPE